MYRSYKVGASFVFPLCELIFHQDLQGKEGEEETESEKEEELEKVESSQRRAGRKARVEIEYEQETESKRTRLKAWQTVIGQSEPSLNTKWK